MIKLSLKSGEFIIDASVDFLRRRWASNKKKTHKVLCGFAAYFLSEMFQKLDTYGVHQEGDNFIVNFPDVFKIWN